MTRQFKVTFYVPASHLDQVKNALFDVGGGKVGNYDRCAWQTLGQGQFRALSGSQPFLGQKGQVEFVEEYLVEMVCDEDCLKACVFALKEAHPYETPAYAVLALEPSV